MKNEGLGSLVSLPREGLMCIKQNQRLAGAKQTKMTDSTSESKL